MVYDPSPMPMQTRLSWLVSGLALILLVGSCTNKDPVTLVVSTKSSTTFAPDLEGAAFKMAIVDVDAKKVVETDSGTVAGGRIAATVMVDADAKYRADIFIDADDDGKCQFGIDSVYAIDIQNTSGGSSQDVVIDPTLLDSRGCLGWGGSTLHATVSNFTASGSVYKAVLTRTEGSKKLQLKTGAVTGNTITIDFPGAIIPGFFYQLDVYIDNNGDDQCNASVDSIFTKTSSALPPGQTDGVTGDTVPLMLDGDLNQGASCSSFQ